MWKNNCNLNKQFTFKSFEYYSALCCIYFSQLEALLIGSFKLIKRAWVQLNQSSSHLYWHTNGMYTVSLVRIMYQEHISSHISPGHDDSKRYTRVVCPWICQWMFCLSCEYEWPWFYFSHSNLTIFLKNICEFFRIHTGWKCSQKQINALYIQ